MSERVTVVEGVVSAPPFSRISWGSIIAGTVCAFALQLLLNRDQARLQLSRPDPQVWCGVVWCDMCKVCAGMEASGKHGTQQQAGL